MNVWFACQIKIVPPQTQLDAIISIVQVAYKTQNAQNLNQYLTANYPQGNVQNALLMSTAQVQSKADATRSLINVRSANKILNASISLLPQCAIPMPQVAHNAIWMLTVLITVRLLTLRNAILILEIVSFAQLMMIAQLQGILTNKFAILHPIYALDAYKIRIVRFSTLAIISSAIAAQSIVIPVRLAQKTAIDAQNVHKDMGSLKMTNVGMYVGMDIELQVPNSSVMMAM